MKAISHVIVFRPKYQYWSSASAQSVCTLAAFKPGVDLRHHSTAIPVQGENRVVHFIPLWAYEQGPVTADGFWPWAQPGNVPVAWKFTQTLAQTHQHLSPREAGVCLSQMWAISRETHTHTHTRSECTDSQLLHLVIYLAFLCMDT